MTLYSVPRVPVTGTPHPLRFLNPEYGLARSRKSLETNTGLWLYHREASTLLWKFHVSLELITQAQQIVESHGY